MKELCDRDESTSHVTLGTEGSRETVNRFREKFLKEARNIAKLNHPNIVRIIDVFEENGTAYYVMEYADKGSLTDLVKQKGHLSEEEALQYIHQVAVALDHVHQKRMNHLDVKPSNILVNAEGNAVLIDFGLAKQYDAVTGNQTSTTPVGISHGYAPIEQYKQGGVAEFSPATDIYSLGATLYKLITGLTPPDAQTLIEEPLPDFEASPSTANAILQAMQVSRAKRPQSIAAWLQILDEKIVVAAPLAQKSNKKPESDETEIEVAIEPEVKKPTPKPAPQPASQPAPRPTPKPTPKPQPEPVAPQKKKKSKLWLWITLGVLGLIINIFLILVFIGALAEADDYDDYDYDYYGDPDYYDTPVEVEEAVAADDDDYWWLVDSVAYAE